MSQFLVTAGNTREAIDRVRDWGNIFTGQTGLDIARALLDVGNVTLCTSNLEHARAFAGATGRNGRLVIEMTRPDLLAYHWQFGTSAASLPFPEALTQIPIPEPATHSLLALLPLLQTGRRARKRSRPAMPHARQITRAGRELP
jgi:hypothetical protein